MPGDEKVQHRVDGVLGRPLGLQDAFPLRLLISARVFAASNVALVNLGLSARRGRGNAATVRGHDAFANARRDYEWPLRNRSRISGAM